MKRTTVFLPDELHERLRKDAFEARISMAELIRLKLEPRNGVHPRKRTKDTLAKIEGIVSDGHLSEGIDEALYG